MRRCREWLTVLALCMPLCAPAEAATDDLSIGVFSTGKWYACSDRKIAESIALTFVTEGGEAAITLFNQNALVCDISLSPTKLYVQEVVWHRQLYEDAGRMKVVLMSEWKDSRPSTPHYVLTLRTVNGSGIIETAWSALPSNF